MSVSYTIACHTCKEKMDMSRYTEEFVAVAFSQWGMDEHESHHVSVIADTSSEISAEDEQRVMTYRAVPVKE